jgi:hypothetical protein
MIQKDVALQYYVKICLKNFFKTKFILKLFKNSLNNKNH